MEGAFVTGIVLALVISFKLEAKIAPNLVQGHTGKPTGESGEVSRSYKITRN